MKDFVRVKGLRDHIRVKGVTYPSPRRPGMLDRQFVSASQSKKQDSGLGVIFLFDSSLWWGACVAWTDIIHSSCLEH